MPWNEDIQFIVQGVTEDQCAELEAENAYKRPRDWRRSDHTAIYAVIGDSYIETRLDKRCILYAKVPIDTLAYIVLEAKEIQNGHEDDDASKIIDIALSDIEQELWNVREQEALDQISTAYSADEACLWLNILDSHEQGLAEKIVNREEHEPWAIDAPGEELPYVHAVHRDGRAIIRFPNSEEYECISVRKVWLHNFGVESKTELSTDQVAQNNDWLSELKELQRPHNDGGGDV